MDLFLRRVEPGREAFRVLIKIDETEFEVGSIGIQYGLGADTYWGWGIDTVIPLRSEQSEGSGIDRADCMKKFRAAWERHCARDGWLDEFLAMKRKRM